MVSREEILTRIAELEEEKRLLTGRCVTRFEENHTRSLNEEGARLTNVELFTAEEQEELDDLDFRIRSLHAALESMKPKTSPVDREGEKLY